MRWLLVDNTAMKQHNILVIQGHPNPNSFCAGLAMAYAQGAENAGHCVKLLDLASLQFDPILRHSQAKKQPLEPDLLKSQELITWSSHQTWFFPIWWGATPALVKGWIDRTFTQGFAYQFRENSPFWDKNLAGKTAEIICTMNTPPLIFKCVMGDGGLKGLTKTTFDFCGIETRRITRVGVVKQFSEKQRNQWIDKVKALAAN